MGETVNMHVRDIPTDVKKRLTLLAEYEHISLNALVVRILETASKRAKNYELLHNLPSHDITMDEIIEALHEGRAGR